MSSDQQEWIRVRRAGQGYSAEGKGFYIWDEDEWVVATAALELAGGRIGGASLNGVVIYRDVGVGSLCAPEALDA